MKIPYAWRRWIIIGVFLFLVIVGTVFWITNGNGPLATAISILFVALGVIFSFFQAFFQPNADGGAVAVQAKPNVVPLARVDKREGTRYDWGDAPHVRQFFGRARELALVEEWVGREQCRVVIVLGMGGIGKTTLAAKVAQQVGPQFVALFWRSLQNMPSVEDTLKQCLQFLQVEQSPPLTFDAQLATLLNYLREHRCLLVLDNMESIFQDGGRAGQYREGYEGYGRLLRALGEAQHQGCLLLTSREKPREIVRLEGPYVRSLPIHGVDLAGGRAMLADSGIAGSDESWQRLVARYTGNPLALKLAAETVRDMYGGNIDRFLQEGETVFGDINELLEQQFLRLTPLEQEVLYWLAIEREPVTLVELQELLVHHIQKGRLLEALSSLRRRSMLETNEAGDDPAFTLLPVIVDYVTNRLVNLVYDELIAAMAENPVGTGFILSVAGGGQDKSSPYGIASHALMMAQTRDYIRNSQVRFIVQPLVERLQHFMGKERLREGFRGLLTRLRETPMLASSYAAGNVLNLLVQAYGTLSDYDFSQVTVRQAYLQDATLTSLNFSDAHFANPVFTENFGGILSLAFHPRAPLLAIGTASGEVKLVDVHRGITLFSGHGHTDAIWSVAFSSDGRLLATGSQDHTIRVWATESGECVHLLQEQRARICALAFSPNGQILASGGGDHNVLLWEAATGRYLRMLTEHGGRVLSIAFSPDGRLLASAGEDATLHLTEVATGDSTHILHGHTGHIRIVAFHPQGHLLVSGGEDRLVRVWESASGKCLAALEGHTGMIRSLAFDGTGDLLASGSDDQTVRLWHIEERRCVSTLHHHTNRVWSVALSASGEMAASGSDDQTVRVWELQSQRILYTLQGRTAWVWSLSFNASGDTLASSDYTVRLWDTRTGQNSHVLQGHISRVRSLAFHPTRALLATASEDHTVRIWDSIARVCLTILQGHTDWLRAVAWHPHGDLLASCSADKTARIWNLQGQCLHILRGHAKELRSLAFHPNGSILATSSVDTTVRLWDVASGKELAILQGHTERVRPIAFNCSSLLASGSGDRTIRLWDIDMRKCVAVLEGHTNEVRALAFHPDGELLASSGEEATIRLWSANTYSSLATLEGHTSRIRALAFHPNGELLASGSDDGTIRLWNVSTRQCITILRSDKPYEGMNISNATGLTQGQRTALRWLGAIDGI